MINNLIKGLEKRNKMKAGELMENLIRNKIDPSRLDVTTWVDLLDLEEGRSPKKPA